MRRLLDLWRRRELAYWLLKEHDYKWRQPALTWAERMKQITDFADLLPRDASTRTWNEVMRERAEQYRDE